METIRTDELVARQLEVDLATAAALIGMMPQGLMLLTTIALVVGVVKLAQKKTLWEILGDAGTLQNAKIPAKAAAAIGEFRQMVRTLQIQARQMPVDELIRTLIDTIQYRAEIDRLNEKPNDREMRWNLVEEFVNSAASFVQKEEKPRLASFVQQLSLMDRDDSGSEKEEQLKNGAVILMTLHAAKGLEFPEVYMVGMEEGFLPHRKSIADPFHDNVAEERRLCYVGMTRAKERLTLSLALQRMKWGKNRDTLPSRFLFEMTGRADNPAYAKVLRESGSTFTGRD